MGRKNEQEPDRGEEGALIRFEFRRKAAACHSRCNTGIANKKAPAADAQRWYQEGRAPGLPTPLLPAIKIAA